jgi:putative tryptophan/tyrosine transport system substrate-binding protein
MTRREFMALLGGAAAAWPLAARAQQAGKVWRIGFVAGGERAAVSHILAGFPQGMRELGYAEGRDFTIEWRFAEGNVERFSEFAAELVRLRVDAIVVATAAAVRAVQQATNTIPIIMSYSTDPVGNGFVVSLARPGGNTTGLASSTDDTAPKQLELLTTIAPSIRRVGLLGNPNNPNHSPVLQHAQAAARTSTAMTSPRFRVGDRVEDAVSHRAGDCHVYDDVNIRAALMAVRWDDNPIPLAVHVDDVRGVKGPFRSDWGVHFAVKGADPRMCASEE